MYKFEENSRVCFLGDSIITSGDMIRRVYEYYRKNGIKLEMYNCGVPGDTAIGGFSRLEDTVFCYNPTDVVISFGMNDICYPMYGAGDVTEEIVLERRRLIDTGLIYVRNIANECKKRGVRVLFFSTNPYDELTESETPVVTGATAALLEFSDRLEFLSKNYGGHMINGCAEFYKVSKKLFKEDKTLIGEDRVHPTKMGQELLAQIFLNAQGFDVEIMTDYDEIQEATERPFDEWEEKRFELEQEAKRTEFAQWNIYFRVRNEEFIKADIEKRLKNEENEFLIARMNAYLDGYSQRDNDKNALIEHVKNK